MLEQLHQEDAQESRARRKGKKRNNGILPFLRRENGVVPSCQHILIRPAVDVRIKKARAIWETHQLEHPHRHAQLVELALRGHAFDAFVVSGRGKLAGRDGLDRERIRKVPSIEIFVTSIRQTGEGGVTVKPHGVNPCQREEESSLALLDAIAPSPRRISLFIVAARGIEEPQAEKVSVERLVAAIVFVHDRKVKTVCMKAQEKCHG